MEKLIGRYITGLGKLIPSKEHKYLVIIGGALVERFTDFDLYTFKPELTRYDGAQFRDGLELNIVDTMSTDTYENNDGLILTNHLLGDKSPFTIKVNNSGLRKLDKRGFFITKLATYYDRFEDKDLKDLKALYPIMKNTQEVGKIIMDFGMQDALENFLEDLE